MKKRLLSSLLFFSVFAFGQNDSLPKKQNTAKYYITPTLFIGSGLFINTTKNNWSKQNLQQTIQNKYATNTKVDDYLPYLPIVQMYGGKLMGIKSKNNYFNQTKNLFFSQLFTSLITHVIKRTANLNRPNGGKYAFPSGHTSSAFSSASTLFYEYKDSNLAYASSGFLFAGTTGALRITNNEHWVSDVLVGAGIALLVTHLVYHFEPLKKWIPFKNRKERREHRQYVPVY